MGIIPWSPIARGALARPYNSSTVRTGSDANYGRVREALYNRFVCCLTFSPQYFGNKVGTYEGRIDEEVTNRVEKVAKDKGVSMASIATAWVLSKGYAPIVGLSSEKRIAEAVQALQIKLSDEELKFLEEAYAPKRVQGHS